MLENDIKDIKTLFEKPQDSFRETYHQFKKTFSSLETKTAILNKLLRMVLDDGLDRKEKMTALFILLQNDHYGIPQRKMENPFIETLLQHFYRNPPEEMSFVRDLFLGQKNFDETSPYEEEKTLKEDPSKENFSIKQFRKDISPLKKCFDEFSKIGENVIDPFWEFQLKSEEKTLKNINFADIFPQVDNSNDKLEWMFPYPVHSLQWEEHLEEKKVMEVMRIESLLHRLSKHEKISKEEERFLQDFFQEENSNDIIPQLIKRYFKTHKLKRFIINNRTIMESALIRLYGVDLNEFKRYIEAIMEISVTTKILMLLKSIASKCKFPKMPTEKFAAKTAKMCEKENKNALFIKEFCALLLELFNQKTEFSKDLKLELQSFCVSFNSIKEATCLFTRLKNH